MIKRFTNEHLLKVNDNWFLHYCHKLKSLVFSFSKFTARRIFEKVNSIANDYLHFERQKCDWKLKEKKKYNFFNLKLRGGI